MPSGTLDAPVIRPDLFKSPGLDLGQIPPPPPPGHGDDQPPRAPGREPAISSAKLAMVMVLGAETMFFAGLVGSFLVLRVGAPVWPPPFQPRLPVLVTGLNTLVLLASGVTMARALRAVRHGDQAGLLFGLRLTSFFGALFLAVQGYEWARLVQFGLTVSSGSYGSAFYTLIGTHGVHVLVALCWLSVILAFSARKRFTPGNHMPVSICGMYWQFVVALWPILFLLVYLI